MPPAVDPDGIARIWKRESATVVAVVMRMVRDLALAEDLAQDALVAAIEQWPRTGVPARPGAWLVTTAKNRALNAIKHNRMADRKHEVLRGPDRAPADDVEARLDDDVSDEVLRLLFTACHPVLSREARVALTLRLIGGLSTDEIARAFLVPEPTIAQRIVRAKRTLSEAGVPFELPRADELGPRLASVLDVVYLVFNEGYAATAGDALIRSDLVDEALRLGVLLCELAPSEPEAHALLALMELQASRIGARTDDHGDPVLLLAQDRSRWDRGRIRDGLAALTRAERLAEAPGPFQLQAALAACHSSAPTAETLIGSGSPSCIASSASSPPRRSSSSTERSPSPVPKDPAAGLALIDAIASSPALARYHLLPSARADLLEQLGRRDEARAEFERAASLTENVRQRERLLARAASCQ